MISWRIPTLIAFARTFLTQESVSTSFGSSSSNAGSGETVFNTTVTIQTLQVTSSFQSTIESASFVSRSTSSSVNELGTSSTTYSSFFSSFFTSSNGEAGRTSIFSTNENSTSESFSGSISTSTSGLSSGSFEATFTFSYQQETSTVTTSEVFTYVSTSATAETSIPTVIVEDENTYTEEVSSPTTVLDFSTVALTIDTTVTTTVSGTERQNAFKTAYLADPQEVLWVSPSVLAENFNGPSYAQGQTALSTVFDVTISAAELSVVDASKSTQSFTIDSSEVSEQFVASTTKSTNTTLITNVRALPPTTETSSTTIATTTSSTRLTTAGQSSQNLYSTKTKITTGVDVTIFSRWRSGQPFQTVSQFTVTKSTTASEAVLTTLTSSFNNENETITQNGGTTREAAGQTLSSKEPVMDAATAGNAAFRSAYAITGYAAGDQWAGYPELPLSGIPLTYAKSSRSNFGLSTLFPATVDGLTVESDSWTWRTTTSGPDQTTSGTYGVAGNFGFRTAHAGQTLGGAPSLSETFLEVGGGFYSNVELSSTIFLSGDDTTYSESRSTSYLLPVPQIIGATRGAPRVLAIPRNETALPPGLYP